MKILVKLLLYNDQNGHHKNRGCQEVLPQSLCSLSNGYHPQTEEVYINKRLKEGRVKRGSKKVKTVKIVHEHR
jgi:hypothetical protein